MDKINLLQNKGANNAPNTRKLRRGISFANKTHVRNLYENTGNGSLKVNLDEYNVNATGNVNMPGYSMHSAKFVPHSKSGLQKAMTEMGRLRLLKAEENLVPFGIKRFSNVNSAALDTGYGPALSSFDPQYTPTDKPTAYINRNALIASYGNLWVEAAVVREIAENERQRLRAAAFELYTERLKLLEKEFLKRTRYASPTQIQREALVKINKLNQTKFSSTNMLRIEQSRIDAKAFDAIAAIPHELKVEFAAQKKLLDDQLSHRYDDAMRRYAELLKKARPGKPKLPIVRKTLANRLRNAKAVAKAAAPNFE
jgi:hypothetical protein